MKIKEMEYSSSPNDKILLAEGRHLGYRYIIISYMTHPCCYIQITNPVHPWYNTDYNNISLNIKGKLSYSRNYLVIPDEVGTYKNTEGWWIGWDYNRYNDNYLWTTDKLIDECKIVILEAYSRIDWKDVFETWSPPGEYQKNKDLNRIEGLNKKDNN